MITGAPTKYDISLIDKVDEYLKTTGDKYETFDTGAVKDGVPVKITKLVVDMPMIEGFSDYIDVCVSTINNWELEYPDFLVATNKIRKAQKKVLMNKGVSGEYNPLITRLVLSANHGMREKSDVTSDDKPIQSNTIIVKRMDKDEAGS